MERQSEISHLSDEQVEELYRRYVAGERNSDLVAEYKIEVSPNSLIKVFPPMQLSGVSCPHCDLQMYERRKSKGDIASGDTVGFCKECDHKYYVVRSRGRQRHCTCGPCVIAQAQEQAERERLLREKICQYWQPRVGDAIPYEQLDIQEKVYLLALVNAQADLNLSIVKSVAERRRDVWFAPSESLENEILVLLYRRRMIAVDPESPITAFDSKNVESASVIGVRWIINVTLGDARRSSIEDVQRRIGKDLSLPPVDFDAHQLNTVATSILTEQAIRQIHYQCDRYSLPFTAEKKGRDVIGTLLLSHSLAVVCYFAYLAVRRANDYYLDANISKTQASNIIPGRMQEYGIKAEGEAWDLASKRYLTGDPRSELNKVVFDLVLRALDGGSYKKVDEYFSFVSKVGTPTITSVFSCPVCGSSAVHASVKENCIFVDCKDCISRSPVSLTAQS
ncbi:hypothetical protein [Pseudomonas sp. FSL W5-0203]|uniref:hypothetical protein n=1 Tax=Pseudomonas sp. FSL W5-0203 TaxID=1920491 RepID=UPI000B2AFBE0|nr:hypothetical protein [Pseudomonas sp. FSL W5-0203]